MARVPPRKLRLAVFERDGYRCRACLRVYGADFLHADHQFPWALGGETTYENLATLCRRCNGRKGARLGWDYHTRRKSGWFWGSRKLPSRPLRRPLRPGTGA